MKLQEERAYTNHDTGLLGIFACIFMFIDHAGVLFFPYASWIRAVGRLALPLFAWGIAIGAHHTRNIYKYALRLFVMIMISQPFYMYALNHSLTRLNIFATLFLGLIAILGIKEKKEYITIIALLLAQLLDMDYGLRGVLCVLLLYVLRDQPFWLSICFSAYCVIWGQNSMVIQRTPWFSIRLQTCAIFALPFMLYPRSKRTRTPRWLMYAAYPGHLAIYWLILQLFTFRTLP